MTRLAVGPAWETLPPAEQQQLQAAFAHYVAATYADRFDSYSGNNCKSPASGQTARFMVQTKIVKSNGETTKLDYLMRQDQGSWQISDVYLDGTISQLAVHRSEFHSILRREGVDGLVMALNRKADLLQSVALSVVIALVGAAFAALPQPGDGGRCFADRHLAQLRPTVLRGAVRAAVRGL